MPRAPSAFPFSGRLRRRAINPTPPKRVKAWGDGPLRPEVMYPVWNTPDRTVQHSTTAGRERPTTGHKRAKPERAIYLSLPPTRHDLTQGQKPEGRLSGDKGEGKVGKEPRLEPCLSVLLIGSLSAMWAWWGKQFHEPKCGSGHVCQFTA